ncbi:MAG: hypothetical protein Q7U04_14815, partial [Bacteriovorax sp.]|nr:hypothetical protein [Bacteriovorax sp.]
MMKQVWNFIVLGIVCSFLISTGVMSQDSNQVLDVVKEATTVTNTNENLIVKYTGADPDFDIYNSELQKDVVMQVIAQVTSRLKFCSQPPDMVLAMGAGEAFLAGEIAEYAEAERLKKQMEEVLASTETNDKQIEHLLKLKQSYIDVLAAADRKQNLRNLSSIAFKNAAAVATSEAVEDETYANSCRDY